MSQIRARTNLTILSKLSGLAVKNPGATFDIATDFAASNSLLVSGRLTSGLVTTILVGNPAVGAGLAGVAAFGDAISAIDNGVSALEGLVPVVVGGQGF